MGGFGARQSPRAPDAGRAAGLVQRRGVTAPPPAMPALLEDLRDARRQLLALIDDLSDDQMRVPLLDIVNPPLWEMGHVGWFQERWCLRHPDGRPSIRDDADRLWDSSEVLHDTRWALAHPTRAETREYLARVLELVGERLALGAGDAYCAQLATRHEDMHCEALVYTRRTLGWAAPRVAGARVPGSGPLAGDAEVPGGVFRLGAARDAEFVFDNEKWDHAVRVEPFRIARAAVTQAQFAEFTEAGGYRREELWSADGWRWRAEAGAEHPLHWSRETGRGWLVRDYDRAAPLDEHAAVVCVSWHEAQAWCNWAGRRLPTEAEWEAAALCEPDGRGGLAPAKRRHPWGDDAPTAERAHLDLRATGPCHVGAYPAGDSAFGCRQMTGNVWEWCADEFQPYPGFAPDLYRDYSEPWFGTRKVLRGGAYATRARIARGTYRNFFTPDRRDILAGLRTCAP